MPRNALILLSLLLAAAAASAQTVYRCGNSYGTQPCAGGTAIDVTDRSTSSDAARADKRVAEDWRRAEAMEKARAQALKDAPKAIVIGPVAAASAPKEPAHKEKKKKEPQAFTASGPKKKQASSPRRRGPRAFMPPKAGALDSRLRGHDEPVPLPPSPRP